MEMISKMAHSVSHFFSSSTTHTKVDDPNDHTNDNEVMDGCHTQMYVKEDGETIKNMRVVHSKAGNDLTLDSKGNLVAVDAVTCDPGAHICVGTHDRPCK